MNNPAYKKYLVLLLVVLSLLLYARTINYGFVWDDERIHLSGNNELMQGHIAPFWTAPYRGMYIPMSYTTWAVLKQITQSPTGLSPKAFHVLNVVTHTINVLLVFQLLLLLFKNQSNAFWGSLLFLIHPLHVESIAWISEFRGLYSAFFSLIALIILFKQLDKQDTTKVILFNKNYIVTSGCFVLAMLSKPSAIVLPFIAGIICWCFYRKQLKPIVIGLLIWVLLAAPILYITRQAQPNDLLYAGVGWWQRFFVAGNSVFFYFLKLFIPYPLAACYGNTPSLLIRSSAVYLTTVIVTINVCFLFIKREQYPLLFTGFMVIVICVMPTSGIVPFEYQKHATTADRYMYFGLFGACLWVPMITAFVKKQQLLKYAAIAILLTYGVLGMLQAATWKNEFTVWNSTLKHYQNSARVYYNRGVVFSKMRQYNYAIADYTRCLELQNDFKDALFNRANAFENINNTRSAFNDYNSYLDIDSTDGSVYFKRAYLNYKTGNIRQALRDTKKAELLKFPVDSRFKMLLMQQK